ncbi:MAG: ABC transporter ATP-binding protein/permease [Prevotella sp.]|nr:ABC transporter ATP-binding protein/permease [Prevotella sp.]
MSMKNWLKLPTSRYSTRQIARWLWKALRGNRLQACLNASVGLIGVALSLMSVWAMQRAIDTASGAREGSIYWAIALMAVIILAEFGVGISRVWIRNILGVKAQNRMQQQLVARLLCSQWQGREAMHSGDIINRLEEDVRQVVTFLTETLPSVLSTLAMFFGSFLYLLDMDVVLACITVGILPLFAAISRIYIAYMRRYSREVRQTDSKIQGLLTETMQHRMLVKTMEAEDQMLRRLDRTQTVLRQWVRKRTKFSVISHFFINIGFSLGYLIAFLWGALRLHAGTLTFGGMTAFLQLVNRIQGPARDITRLAPAFVSVFTATERLMELEDNPEEEQGEPLAVAAPCGISFEGVTFYYDDAQQQPVVKEMNYNFAPATCTAVMGQTGSGKTTLIRLLLSLVYPKEGHIFIYNDKGRKEELSPRHRCNFVYVPQGNTLLSGTLRENLRLGNPDATDEEMLEALRLACADFIDDLPEGLDTQFSEHGGGLSEGQAQRISIARALLRPGSIMLLDEATSALDTQTELRVLENILQRHRRTVIIVTHRQAAVDYCSQILQIG